MRLRVYELFWEFDEGDFLHISNKAEVQALEDKNNPVLQAACDRFLANERPLLGEPAIPVVLEGWARAEVTLQECLARKGSH